MAFYITLSLSLSFSKDRARNAAYYRALKAVVTNESVVLDVGSGTSGLLAMMAARLGARRVFTVETNEVRNAHCY
jgi:predicted RNA methylase